MHSHTSVDDHATRVRALLAPLADRPVETVGLDDALGRVTASDVISPVDLPLFRNSQMDGFAVRAADVAAAPVTLPLVGVIAAAAGTPEPLAPGTAVRIMTGAPLPEGADAVAPVEDSVVTGDIVELGSPRDAGEYIRERGSDVSAGAVLVPAGVRLAPRHLAAIAAAGLGEVHVTARVRVAVLTTGAELVAPGAAVGPGQVFDANAVGLSTAVRAVGAELAYAERVPDEPALFAAAFDRARNAADLVLTSGGISRGEFEVVRETLEPRGLAVDHLAMQPGGPQATGLIDGTPVLCFPGNPVSTQVSFEVFAAPVLRQLAGMPARDVRMRILNIAVNSSPGKRQFLRGVSAADGTVADNTVDVISGPGSHLVAGMAASDVLVVVPEEVTRLEAGSEVETWQL